METPNEEAPSEHKKKHKKDVQELWNEIEGREKDVAKEEHDESVHKESDEEEERLEEE
ncbi:hypothetical protein J4219_04440 [Candidatus Woesearchaeota archaeon]|nr:hypothetical protein [Candidatus Woesearchaeota archaeon]